ncbi:putative protein kinase UbiB [Lentibacillus sp. JNUCC-1]|nr:AarF/ABC1/UbiB kinase family protein [Lentibacillus sp. JNUCC-1]MUV36783.1 putative protein kinase UbiB [Lentibacillus sp. JNUCC-1]
MFRRIRYTKRFQEILNVLFKNGFSHILFRVGLSGRRPVSGKQEVGDMNFQDIGKKLKNSMQELGPTFIKLGQIASSRRDMIPMEIISELEKLQDDVEAFSFDDAKDIIEEELDNSLDNLFLDFNEEPLATASIGQVYRAHLLSGEEVAIKVQRPEIEDKIETDLSIVRYIAQVLEERTKWAKNYHLCNMVDEFSESLQDELNYNAEGRNADRIRHQFKNNPDIYVPDIYWDFTTEKVLTMEYVKGIKINAIDQLAAEGYDLELVTDRVADAMMKQMLEHGFFHGDPHPGNIYIMPGNQITFIDFGMVGRLSQELRHNFASLIIYLNQGNTKGMIKTFTGMGMLSEEADHAALTRDLDRLQSQYYDIPLSEISLAEVMMKVFRIAYKHEIELPTDIAILGKVVLELEEVLGKLNPDFSIMSGVEPFGKKILRERYNPASLAKRGFEEIVENARILSDLPQQLKDVTSMIKRGKLRVDIHVSDLEVLLKRLDRISNRLSFSIILLSFSILMVGLIVGAAISGQTTMIWRLPVIEVGSVIATLMFILMIYTIIRNGRM